MPFYGPLIATTWHITKEWLLDWAVFRRAALAIIIAASVLFFEYMFPRDGQVSALTWRVLRMGAEAILGIVATVAVLLLISLFYYAPTEVLTNAVATTGIQPKGLRLVTMPIQATNPEYPYAIKVILQFDRPLSLPRRFIVTCDRPIGDGTVNLTHIGTIYSIGNNRGNYDNVWGATIDALASGGPLDPDNQVVFELSAKTPLRAISAQTSS